MNIADRYPVQSVRGSEFPKFKGHVKLNLHNPTTGKNQTYESDNLVSNALYNIFAANFGGLINYNNFASLFNTWLGGVLLFENVLDTSSPNNYFIPANNPITAHAGQMPYSSQNDDTSRGNPIDAGVILQASTVKLKFEWGLDAGNGDISALGLTHTDVGSYGAGIVSTAQKSLNPFVEIGCLTGNTAYGDNANSVLGIDTENNYAYTFYLVSSTSVNIYKTPINATKYKLQGGSLVPLTDYTQTPLTVTIQNYNIHSKGCCYYHFDFTANTLTLFGIPTEGGTTIYKDVINLSTGAVTSSSLTVSGARLWKFYVPNNYDSAGWGLAVPTKAMISGDYLYVYAYGTGQKANWHPSKMFRVNINNDADFAEIDTTSFSAFAIKNNDRISEPFAILNGVIIHNSFIIKNNKAYELEANGVSGSTLPNKNYADPYKVSSPVFGLNNSSAPANYIRACKYYLGTIYNLPNGTVTKNASQSMSLEYTLTEV